MPLLSDFPSPQIAQSAFAGGYTAKGVPLLTLDELEQYSTGKGARRERRYKCPFCGAGERAFHVNTETGAFNCKRGSCAVKGCLREFWREAEPLGARARAMRDTARAFEAAPDRAPQLDQCTGQSEQGNWRAQWESARPLDAPDAHAARAFLSGRGLSLPAALATGARYCLDWAPSPEGAVYFGGAAILYPLSNPAREVVAVGGRYLRPRERAPKARTGGALDCGAFLAPAFDGSKWVCPLDWETPFVVEGPADALALAQCGAPALAAHGTCLAQWIAGALAFKAPFLAPDVDAAGEKALPIWTRDLAPFAPRLRALRPPVGKDFGEMLQSVGRAEMRVWLRGAGVPLLDRHSEADALARLAPSIRKTFARAIAVEIGLLSLALDAGFDIE